MTAQDFPVYFRYGATTPPYTTNSPHRGEDRCNQWGVPVVVEGTQIGLVGATGKVYDANGNLGTKAAAHLHTQEWRLYPSNTRKPQNSFKGGTVIHTSFSSDFGNYVTIQSADGWNTSYCHLSRIDVKVGQVIGESDTMTESSLATLYQIATNTQIDGNDKFVKDYAGKSPDATMNDLIKSKANIEMRTKAANYDNVRGALDVAYAEIEKLRNESSGEAQEKLNKIMEILEQE